MRYEFEGCVLDTSTQELRRDGELVAVQPQVFAVLEHLLANPGRVVSKFELLDEVWGDRFVSESALTSRIKLARQACGDTGRVQRVIKTVHGRGYRLVAEISERGAASAAPAAGRAQGAIERVADIERLVQVAEGVALGTPATVFVTGPVGVGKSTVVAGFLERIDDFDRWLVLRGRCHRSRSGPEPYFALLDALGSLAATEPDVVRDTLDRVAPSWLVQLPALVDDETAGRLGRRLLGGARQRMLREGADAFSAFARRRPTLLLIDDLHQADDCTLDVLELLVTRGDPVPLLIVATARPGSKPVDSLIAELRASGSADAIELGPMDEAAIGRMLADRLSGTEISPELVALVHDRSGGNPLFAQEILTAWEAAGSIEVGHGLLAAGADAEALAATVPPTLLHLLDRALEGLNPDERSVLESAAAAGAAFDAAAVAAGLDRPLPEVEAVLGAMARRSDQIEATGATVWPEGTVSTCYRFVHDLQREVVHDRTAAGLRAALHQRIGMAVESAFGAADRSVAATLADHFVAAGDAPRAARYLRRVAAQAIERQAHEHAEAVLHQALEHLERIAPGPERDRLELDVRLALGQARVGIGGWLDGEAARQYERALTLADQLRAADEAAQARYALATVSEMNGDFGRTETLLTPVLVDDDDELDIEAHELVACSTFHRGAFERSAQNAEAALAAGSDDDASEVMARVAEHPATSCNSWLSLTNWYLGRSDDSLRRADHAVRLGERHRYALGMATYQRAMLHQLRNEPEACREWADRTLALEAEHVSRPRRLQAGVLRSWAVSLAHPDTVDDLLAELREAVERVCDSRVWLDPPYYLALLADVLLAGGRPDEALVALARAADRIDEGARAYFHRSEIHRLRARAISQLGGADAGDRARAELDESLAVAESMGSPALALRTVCDRFELELELADGDHDPWRTRLAALVSRYDGQAAPPDVRRGQALLSA